MSGITGNILNIVILSIAIMLVVYAKQGLINTDSFVGKVPQVNIGNGYGGYNGNRPYQVQGQANVIGQPMVYPEQLYQAKYPYVNDSVKQFGKPCKDANSCGVLGACVEGTCSVKGQDNTVWNMVL